MDEERVCQKEQLLASAKVQKGLTDELKKLHDYCAYFQQYITEAKL